MRLVTLDSVEYVGMRVPGIVRHMNWNRYVVFRRARRPRIRREGEGAGPSDNLLKALLLFFIHLRDDLAAYK